MRPALAAGGEPLDATEPKPESCGAGPGGMVVAAFSSPARMLRRSIKGRNSRKHRFVPEALLKAFRLRFGPRSSTNVAQP
jgi:hypothetical protein